ncbi:MAG: hypothetical protein ACFFCO_01155 [Promethearchaeota archaeon]
MGLKGWIGWRIKVRKTSLNVFQALVAAIVDYVLREVKGDIKAANDKLFQIGMSMAETLLFEYSDSIGEHAVTFDGFLKTFNLATKVMLGKAFEEAYWDSTERKIVYAYKDCPICEGVKLSEEYEGLKYCNALSGVFHHVLTLRGFSGECEEVKCKTWGDEACVWELREK